MAPIRFDQTSHHGKHQTHLVLGGVARLDHKVENSDRVQEHVVEMNHAQMLNQVAHAAHNVEKLGQQNDQQLLIEQVVDLLYKVTEVGLFVQVVEDVLHQIALSVDVFQFDAEDVQSRRELE